MPYPGQPRNELQSPLLTFLPGRAAADGSSIKLGEFARLSLIFDNLNL
jgi:hypothetical protein